MVSIKDLKLTITADPREAVNALNKVEQAVDDVEKKTSTFGTSAVAGFAEFSKAAAGAGLAIGAVAAAAAATKASVDKIATLAIDGDAYVKLQATFEGLSASAGKTASVFLNDLRGATEGAISDIDLFAVANKALTLDLEGFGVGIVELAGDVKAFSDITGKDAKESLDTFIQAIATGRMQTLATQGIFVDTEAAAASYAKSIGKAANELSKYEKITSNAIALQKELKAAVEAAGDTIWTAGDAAAAYQSELKNASDEFMGGIANSKDLTKALEDLSKTLANTDWEAFGERAAKVFAAIVDAAAWALEALEQFSVGLDRIFSTAEESANKSYNQTFNSVLGDMKGKGVTELEDYLKQQQAALDLALKNRQESFDKFNKLNAIPVVGEFLGSPEADKFNDYSGQAAALIETIKVTQREIDMLAKKGDSASKVVDKLLNPPGGSGKGSPTEAQLEAAKKAAEEAEKQIKALSDSFTKLGNQTALDTLDRKVEEAFDSGGVEAATAALNEYYAMLEKIAKADFYKQYQPLADAGKVSQEEIDSLYAAQAKNREAAKEGQIAANKEVAEDLNKQLQEASSAAFEESASYFGDLIYNALNGSFLDFEDMGKRILADIAGGFFASLSGGFSGVDVKNIGGMLAQELGLGSLFGSTATAGAAGAVGAAGASGVSGVAGAVGAGAAGAGLQGAMSGVMAAVTPAILAYAGAQVIDIVKNPPKKRDYDLGSFKGYWDAASRGKGFQALASLVGGGGDPQELGRRGFRDFLTDKEGGLGVGERFQTTFGTSQSLYQVDYKELDTDLIKTNSSLEKAIQLTGGLAKGFAAIYGDTTGQLGEQFNRIFAQWITGFEDGELAASSFGDMLVNTRLLLQEAGASSEDLKDALMESFWEGTISLEEFGAQIQNINELTAGILIPGIGGIAEAFAGVSEQLEEGNYRAAFEYLIVATNEAREEGINDMSALAEYATSAFGPAVGAAFQAMAAGGITSFEQLSSISSDQLYLILSALTPIISEMSNLAEATNGASEAFVGLEGTTAGTTSRMKTGVKSVSNEMSGLISKIEKAIEKMEKLKNAAA